MAIQEAQQRIINTYSFVTTPFIPGRILAVVGQPREYTSLEVDDIRERARVLGLPNAKTWESATYPARAALGLGMLPDVITVLPDIPGVREYAEGLEEIRKYYALGDPLAPLWVPDFHEPQDTLDAIMLRYAPDIARQLRRLSADDHLTVMTHATTPETQEWITILRDAGIKIDPLFRTKTQERPGYAYRYGFSSWREGENPSDVFAALYGIPAAFGRIAYTKEEAERGYEAVVASVGSSRVFTKIDASGGGTYMGIDQSAEDVVKRFAAWRDAGKLEPIHENPIPIEIQPFIHGIVSIGSFQYVGHEIVTPGPGYTTQIIKENTWQGNIYNTVHIAGVPDAEQAGVRNLIGEFQRRFMIGIQEEEKEFSTGGVDFAIARISDMPNPEAFIPEDMLQLAQALEVDYMPIAIEHNGQRVSDALWPAMFAKQLGITDTPFMSKHVSPVLDKVSVAWEHIVAHDMHYTKEKGEGIVPMHWVHDTIGAIHSGAMLVVGKNEEVMQHIFENAVLTLREAGIIGEEDSLEYI